MGLGKTLQSICILSGDYNEKSLKSSDWIPSIIVCPTTLTNHWFHEIKKYSNIKYLNPIIYCGSIAERENVKRLFQSKNYNVLIVSYDIVRHDVSFISSFQWNYCILDEGHLIKSTKTKLSKAIKLIYAMHRLILTGTPIQNNVCELWCLFDFLIPGYLGTEKQFHLKYARYIVPPGSTSTRTFERLCSQVQQKQSDKKNDSTEATTKDFHQLSIIALESLHKQVLPFLLRRTKEEVLEDLPPKIIQDYYCEMSNLQKELYQDFSRSTQVSDNNEIKKAFLYEDDEEPNENDDDNCAPKLTEHIFQALQYLRKVVNHPSLVLKPSHPKWNKLQAEYSGNINDIRHSGKLLALKDLLHECGIGVENSEQQNVVNQHRVLIFCQLKAMIDIVENELLKNMENVSYLRLDGTIPASERYNVTHRFNSDPSIDILLLTTQIGGLGLNLTGADTVIFIEHDWNPQKDLQAMDRAHRIGQKKVVNVYRLITKRTIEEKIMRYYYFYLYFFFSSQPTIF
jgi:TATA-binding protein-associated factor